MQGNRKTRDQCRIRSWRSADVLTQTTSSTQHRTALDEAEKIFKTHETQAAMESARRALLRERRKRRANHHSYDLGRHIRLVRLGQQKGAHMEQCGTCAPVF